MALDSLYTEYVVMNLSALRIQIAIILFHLYFFICLFIFFSFQLVLSKFAAQNSFTK